MRAARIQRAREANRVERRSRTTELQVRVERPECSSKAYQVIRETSEDRGEPATGAPSGRRL